MLETSRVSDNVIFIRTKGNNMEATLDTSTVAEENAAQWEILVEAYGDKFKVPTAESNRVREIIRGMYILMGLAGKEAPVYKTLRVYGIPEEVCAYLIDKYCGEDVATEDDGAVRRKDKYRAFEDWSREHIGEQFTTEQLVEASGFSYPTTLKFLKESPLFKPVNRGWRVPVVVETRH